MRFVKILDEYEVKRIFGKEWYLQHHPVLNPNMSGEERRVCNAASKYREINDMLLAGPALLHGLLVTVVRFRTISPDSFHRIDVFTSASSRTG